jgi:hypothetical protein
MAHGIFTSFPYPHPSTLNARTLKTLPITHTTSLIATTQHPSLVDDEYNDFIVPITYHTPTTHDDLYNDPKNI